MRDVLYLEQIEQAEALLKPQRIEVLRQLAEPRTCTEVAARLGQTPQRVYYHVKRLVDAGLVDLVSERRVRGIHEGIYQASRPLLLAVAAPGRPDRRCAKAQDELSLGYLLDLMEDVQADIAALDRTAPELPSIGAVRRDPRRAGAAAGVPERPADHAAGPVHPLRRRRRRRLQARRRLLSQGRTNRE